MLLLHFFAFLLFQKMNSGGRNEGKRNLSDVDALSNMAKRKALKHGVTKIWSKIVGKLRVQDAEPLFRGRVVGEGKLTGELGG